MSNRILTLAALACAAVSSFAEVRWGQVELAFFRVRDEDGRMVDLPTKGIVLPVRMERIDARPVNQTRNPFSAFQFPPTFPEASTVYQNDTPSNYFYDPQGASSADDINILPSGNGQWWYDLTLGVNTVLGNSVKVMNRQLGWQFYTEGLGHDVQSLTSLVFDVGWVFLPGQFPPGSWKYTIPIHNYWSQIPNSNKPRVPNGLIYFAQQWRAYHILGEGAFLDGDFSSVFSGDLQPQVGSSEDVYWGDWDPMNGTYAEDEVDFFGGEPNFANFLMTLSTQATGVTDTVRPTSVSLFRGIPNGGNVGSLHFVDQNYYRANKGFTVNAQEAPIQIIMEGFASTASLTGLSADIMTQANTGGLQQTVDMYNFTTNQWVQVDQRAAPTSDTRLTVGAPGTPSNYVDAPNGNIVRMRVSFKATGLTTLANWGCRVDLSNWLASHP